jgi:cell division septal protein FtsQ
MSTISTTTPRSANMISTIALAIVLVALLAFVVAQSVTAPKAAVISVTGSQNVNSATRSYIAWAQYLLTAPAK